MNLEVRLLAFARQRWTNPAHLGALCAIFNTFHCLSVKKGPSNVKNKDDVPLDEFYLFHLLKK